ncbi:MAG: hypothetical protein H6Q16_208 [Bacteroidetes bacterium]|nr:hypothetical protein [Bacteroidota bacterium]
MDIKENDLNKRSLRGKIKFLEEKTYYAIENSGEIEKGEFISCHFTSFNEEGNLLVEVNDSAHSSSKEIYVYDSNGNIIEEKLTDSHNTYNHSKYIFDHNNKITERYRYDDSGNLIIKDYYTYDLNENLIEINSYCTERYFNEKNNYTYYYHEDIIEEMYQDSDRLFEGKTTYEYDSNGKLIEEKEYDSNRRLKEKTIYKYDDNGKLIEENYYDLDEILHWKNIYDPIGNLIEESEYDSDGNICQKEAFNNKYNSEGKLIYRIEEQDDYFKYITICKYESNGKGYDGWIRYNSEGELMCDRNYIEFDDKNNWIKYTDKLINGIEITIRHIDYYEDICSY